MGKIKTRIIQDQSYTLFILLYIALGILLTTYLFMKSGSYLILIAGFVIFMIFPAIFSKRYRRRFSTDAEVNMTDSSWEIVKYNLGGNPEGIKQEIDFDKVQSFRIMNSSHEDSAFLKIYFKDGTHFRYVFINQDEIGNNQYISDLFLDAVKKYNVPKDTGQKILISPNFFATNGGRISIILLSVLIMIAFVLCLVYKPIYFPTTLAPGLVLYIMIMTQRSADKKLINRMDQ